MWVLHTDHLMTRRKVFHIVCDPDDRIRFRHRFIGPCLDYLDTEEVRDYYVSTPSAKIRVSVTERTKQYRRL